MNPKMKQYSFLGARTACRLSSDCGCVSATEEQLGEFYHMFGVTEQGKPRLVLRHIDPAHHLTYQKCELAKLANPASFS